MIPVLGNVVAPSGASDGSNASANGAQGADKSGIFGDMLLAESSAAGSGGGTSGTTTGSGNPLPPGGNPLPADPRTTVAAEFDLSLEAESSEVLQLASGENLAAASVAASSTADVAANATASATTIAVTASTSTSAETDALAENGLLYPTAGIAIAADGTALPAAESPLPKGEALDLQPAAISHEAVAPSPSVPDAGQVAVPTTATTPNAGTGSSLLGEMAAAPALSGAMGELRSVSAPLGRDSVVVDSLQQRPQSVVGANTAGLGDSAAQNAGNVLGNAAIPGLDRQPVTVADEVLLESVDASRIKTSPLLTGAQPLTQAQPLVGLAAPMAIDPAVAAAKVATLPPLSTPPGEPEWSGELATRVSIMLKNGAQEASLALNPPELGRLDIRISTEGDQARVQFAVHNPDARDVLEQNMPRLRELLEQGGMQLARGDVADHSQNREQSAASGNHQGAGSAESEPAENTRSVTLGTTSDARVDYYV